MAAASLLLRQEGWGVWWRDTRGVNDFEQTQRLILIGTPCRNLADLQAEYAILSGCHDAEDEGFKAFVNSAIRADFQQGTGRPRAHRRPNEQIEVIVLSDFDLALPQVNYVCSTDITPEAASKSERLLIAAKRALAKLQGTGKKITQAAVAELCECSQQRISQLWSLLKMLLESTNSKSGKAFPEEWGMIAETAIAECLTEKQAIDSVENIFLEWLDPDQRKLFWQNMKAETQIRILEALLLLIPEERIHALCSISSRVDSPSLGT